MERHFARICRLTRHGKVCFACEHTVEFTRVESCVLCEQPKLYKVSFFKPKEGKENLSEIAILNEGQLEAVNKSLSDEEMLIENKIKQSYSNSASHKVPTSNIDYSNDEEALIRERYEVIE